MFIAKTPNHLAFGKGDSTDEPCPVTMKAAVVEMEMEEFVSISSADLFK